MTKNIHQPNDSLFKKSLSHIRVAKDFFVSHLPSEILDVIDLNQLQLENHSFIDERYSKSESDVIYSAKTIDNHPAYFYLLCEQQSTVHKNMPFRLWKYKIRLMDQHVKQHPTEKTLPIVYPIVVYSGERPWNKSRNILSYFGEQENLARTLWDAPFQLIDLHRIEDSEMRDRILSGLMEFALKNKVMRDFRGFLKMLLPWLNQIDIEHSDEFGKIVLEYVLDEIDETDKWVFIEETEKHRSSDIGRTTMTLAEQFREEGLQKGLQKGLQEGLEKGRRETMTLAEQFREEGLQKGLQKGREKGRIRAIKEMAAKMLGNGMSTEIVEHVTGLSLDEINALQEEDTSV